MKDEKIFQAVGCPVGGHDAFSVRGKKEEPTVTEEEVQEEASVSDGAEAAEESADEDFPDTRENESGQTMTDEEYQEYLERANSARWLAFELPEGWVRYCG